MRSGARHAMRAMHPATRPPGPARYTCTARSEKLALVLAPCAVPVAQEVSRSAANACDSGHGTNSREGSMHPALLRGAEQLACTALARLRAGSGVRRAAPACVCPHGGSYFRSMRTCMATVARMTGTRAKTEQTTNTRKPNTLLPGVLNRVWADRSRRLGAGDWAARRTGGRAPERRVKAAGRDRGRPTRGRMQAEAEASRQSTRW